MTAASQNLSAIWLHIQKYQRPINVVVVVVLSVYLLHFAAQLTWRLLPEPTPDAQNTPPAASVSNRTSAAGPRIDLAAIDRLHLFGDPSAVEQPTQPVVTDAPQTRLNLTLHGVVATTTRNQSAAIIENRGTQATYGLNEKIDGTNAILKEVFADRVILQNGPSRETLMLDGLEYEKPSTQRASAKPVRPSFTPSNPARQQQPEQDVNRTLSRDAAEATRELQENPGDFTDYIAISPQQQDGELVGYQVSPGRKPQLFQAAGLQSGDIITEINGLDLTDPQQALEAMNMLRTSLSLQITVNRAGDLLTLYLDMPEPGAEL
ncbi:type II secretion system protein GspC [Aestuariibacter halophilus]|uniref:Type II secretion system protein GspC n=1 Tax=Fluctibacter halophilus TaxID=226011 RepID=A0ABS8G8Z3_9ALTE|nr:type II secretion system protein GspC [Aestuariibacter halophilus]MCC2617054.1 type II secretion system protein GspC [Aestuariibacter halophilus]